ncbi:ATP-dependent RNA helicase dbp6 [Balamuthia mandrillaris]
MKRKLRAGEEGPLPAKEPSSSSSSSSSANTSEAITTTTTTSNEEDVKNLSVHQTRKKIKAASAATTPTSLLRKKRSERIIDNNKRTPVGAMPGLSPVLAQNLAHRFGIERFFPVQSEVIPAVMRSVACGGSGEFALIEEEEEATKEKKKETRKKKVKNTKKKTKEEDENEEKRKEKERRKGVVAGDICVCAPTGSGKTLAYAVPIVNALLNRVIRLLRALVIVPNRDLALQVKSVFDLLCTNTSLKVEVVVGQSPFKQDQAKLVRRWPPSSTSSKGAPLTLYQYDWPNQQQSPNEKDCQPREPSEQQWEGLVDILVCTPGRLIDLLAQTEGFTLSHLRFLVIDEADRLLMQSFQNWLPKVLLAAQPGQTTTGNERKKVDTSLQQQQQQHLHKLLFSATLTHNPKKIASLQLQNPQFFTAAAHALYKMPDTLEEYMVVCSLKYKPLILLHLMHLFDFKRTLCFTASVEATHRLYLLLSLMGQKNIAEYSGTQTQAQRSRIVSKFRAGEIRIVIASDAMARGLDFEEVENVVNYDSAPYIKTYVHRVGRTARAGRTGRTFTLLRREEIFHFRQMLSKAERSNSKDGTIGQVNIDEEKDLAGYVERYEEALGKLKDLVKPQRTSSSASQMEKQELKKQEGDEDDSSSSSSEEEDEDNEKQMEMEEKEEEKDTESSEEEDEDEESSEEDEEEKMKEDTRKQDRATRMRMQERKADSYSQQLVNDVWGLDANQLLSIFSSSLHNN